MPAKQTFEQHNLLHLKWPHDCCLCAAEKKVGECLKALLDAGALHGETYLENARLRKEIGDLEEEIDRLHDALRSAGVEIIDVGGEDGC